MEQVAAAIARAALKMARDSGFDAEKLGEGLPTLHNRKAVAWDDFCLLVERIEAAAGGPEACRAMMARSYHTAMPREAKAVFGAFVSPRLLYRFLFKVVNPVALRAVETIYEECGGSAIRIRHRLRPPMRACRAFLSGSVGGIQGVPGHLGLPMADVEVEELTDRALTVLVIVPPSETLLARAPGLGRAALRFFEGFGAPPPAKEEHLPEAQGRVEELRLQLDLTDRQAQVLERLAHGCSNKEIAASLDASEKTVEFHVTQLLRKAGVDSRALLIARFWAGRSRPI